jgi:hypothetical protein
MHPVSRYSWVPDNFRNQYHHFMKTRKILFLANMFIIKTFQSLPTEKNTSWVFIIRKAKIAFKLYIDLLWKYLKLIYSHQSHCLRSQSMSEVITLKKDIELTKKICIQCPDTHGYQTTSGTSIITWEIHTSSVWQRKRSSLTKIQICGHRLWS